MHRDPRKFNDKHLDFIRSLPCIVTGDNVTVEAVHIRMNDPRIGKANPGSHKPHDYFTLPLSGEEHRRQHKMNERVYWQRVGIDPVFYALALYAVSGDYEQGCKIVECARRSTVDNVLAAG